MKCRTPGSFFPEFCHRLPGWRFDTGRNRFSQQKRAKEIARQQKQEEKLKRRQNKDQPIDEAPEDEAPESDSDEEPTDSDSGA
jgi:hypothetical protein